MPHELRRQRGVIAVEAAYVLPVVIAAAMMCIELVRIGLTINIGSSALERAVQGFRADGVAALQGNGTNMKALLRQRMAADSHGYLAPDEIVAIDIEPYDSLDAMGGGSAREDAAEGSAGGQVPAWRISVDIRRQFITPLPRLLGIDNDTFGYRYEQVLAYLPAPAP